MNFTMEELRAMEEEQDARKAAEMDDLEAKSPKQLLDLYSDRLAAVETAMYTETLEKAERDVEILTEAIIARMS